PTAAMDPNHQWQRLLAGLFREINVQALRWIAVSDIGNIPLDPNAVLHLRFGKRNGRQKRYNDQSNEPSKQHAVPPGDELVTHQITRCATMMHGIGLRSRQDDLGQAHFYRTCPASP